MEAAVVDLVGPRGVERRVVVRELPLNRSARRAEGGIARLERFAQENPKNPRADNALYFSALGYMGLGRYEAAADRLEKLRARYPAGDAVPEALLKLAECRLRLKQAANARSLYSKVIASYPGTVAASTAQDRLASLEGRKQ